MSDIKLDFPLPLIGVFLCMLALPWLATATALLGLGYWKLWRSRAGLVVFVLSAIPTAAGCAGYAYQFVSDRLEERSAAAYTAANTRTLTRPEKIGGIVLPRATNVFRDSDGFGNATITTQRPIDAHGVPVTGRFEIADLGLDGEVTLAKNALVNGVPCSATAPVKFQNGKFLGCFLSTMHRIDGIPCGGALDLSETLSCELAVPFRSAGIVFPRGAIWIQTSLNGVDVLFGDGVQLFVLGTPAIAQEAWIDRGRVTVRVAAFTYRGCRVDWASIDRGKSEVKGEGCHVGLPSGALRFRV